MTFFDTAVPDELEIMREQTRVLAGENRALIARLANSNRELRVAREKLAAALTKLQRVEDALDERTPNGIIIPRRSSTHAI